VVQRVEEQARRARHELAEVSERFLDHAGNALEQLAERCAAALQAGGKLLVFGNGGSAAQAQHLAAELVNRFEQDRPALAAVALGADTAVLSSVANDDAFERVFSRQIEALGRPGDVALALSTSGRSPNVVAGLRAARGRGLLAAALLGGDGGPALEAAELALVVPSDRTARVQEVHLLAVHVLCGWLEHRLADPSLDAARRRAAPTDPAT